MSDQATAGRAGTRHAARWFPRATRERESIGLQPDATRKSLPKRCAYCGQTTTAAVACGSCAHLLPVDPHYTPPDQWKRARRRGRAASPGSLVERIAR